MQIQADEQSKNSLGREPQKKKLTVYLGALAIVLALTVGGAFYYFHQQANRFESQCVSGEQMTLEIKSLLEEVKSLPGEADNETVKDWTDKLAVARTNMDKFCSDLKSSHPSSKYKQSCSNLYAAAEIERSILEAVAAVVKEPLSVDTADKIKAIDDKVQDLREQAASVEVGQTDFASSMDLTTLKDNLTAFVNTAKEAERRRQEEEARQAREREKQRLADIQTRLKNYNDSVMANTHDMEWLATGVTYTNAHRLELHGFFYNGTNNPVVRINNMTMSITLYKQGEVIYQRDNFYFRSTIDLYGAVAPGTKKFNDLYVTGDDVFPQDFDEFRIKTADMNWTYIR